MSNISRAKLQQELNQTSSALSNPAEYQLADRIVAYCRTKRETPYDSIIIPTHTTPPVYAAWSASDVKNYFSDALSATPANVWDGKDETKLMAASVDLVGRHFKVTDENGPTLYRIVDEGQGVVRPVVQNKELIQVGFAISDELAAAGRPANPGRVNQIYGFYLMNTPRIKKPKLLGQLGEDNWCLHRQTIVPDASMPYPHCQTMLNRLSDPFSTAAWCYGVASGRYRGRQILYISDPQGLGGKSKFFKAFSHACFGEEIATAFNSNILSNSSHASSHFAGKKVAVVGDNKNPNAIMTQALKEMSGDDKSLLNPKHLPAYSTTLECNVVILGNCEPNITSEMHNQSRTLWIKMAPLVMPDAERDPDWGDKCKAEMPGFLAFGKECYEMVCKNDFAIRANEEVEQAVERKVRECEDEFSIPFEQFFVAEANGRVNADAFYKIVRETLKWDNNKIKNFKDWMDRHYDVRRQLQPGRGYVYVGIRLRKGRDRLGGDGPGGLDELLRGAA